MRTKEKLDGVQISSNSDMVLHEKFDNDFTKAAVNLNLLSDNADPADMLVSKE